MLRYIFLSIWVGLALGQWDSGAPTDVTLDPRWKGLAFNGSTFVNMSGFNLNGTSFTVEALIQPTNIDGDKCIFGVDSTTALYGLHLVLRGGVVYMGFYGYDTSGVTVVPQGKWSHVTFRYNASRKEQSVFLNGVLDAKSAGKPALLGTIPMSYNIGKCIKTTSNAFLGKIAYVRVWGTARTDLEISSGIWTTPSIRNGLIAAYEFDQEGSSTDVTDLTGAYNGKLYLGKWYVTSAIPTPCSCVLPVGKCPTSIFETVCDCARDPSIGYWIGDTCKSCLKTRDSCDGYEGANCTDRCVSRTKSMVEVPIPSSVVKDVAAAFPEGKPVNSTFLNYTNINLRCLTECRLNVSFLYEGASYHNSLGYFTYDPKTLTVINDVVIIPDASVGSSSNCVSLGTSVLNIGPFPAETHIGFWIWSDAFCNPNRNNGTKLYSIPSLNKDKFNHLAVMPLGDRLVLGFEDIIGLGDKDYNDVMLVANISGILASNALPPIVPQSYLSDVILVVPNNCFTSATDYQYLTDFVTSFANSRLPTLGLIVYNSEAKVLVSAGTVDKTLVSSTFKAEAKCSTQSTTCCTSLTYKAYKLAESEISKLDSNRAKLIILITDVGTIPQTSSTDTVNTGTNVVQTNPNITVVTIAVGTTVPSAEVIVSKPENARVIPSYSTLSTLAILTETSTSQVCNIGVWSPWSECTVACGGGTRFRNRTVLNQDPKYTPCPGEVEVSQCNTQACCTVGEWSSWTECSKQCDGGVSSRTRTVTKGADSAVCPDSKAEQTCNTQLCCQYSEWTSWSACSADCDGGSSTSTRTVTKGAPSASCESSSRSQSCNTQLCCGYGDWAAWGECSAKCDGGSQISIRVVTIGAVSATCLASARTQTCNIQKCCDFGAWSEWSTCSKDCDIGTQTQTRTLVKGSPDASCDSPTSNSQNCNTQACCTYSEWGSWSVCSKLCDGGVQSRKRTVSKGASSAVCETDTEEQTCNSSPCCTYGAWGEWQQCSAACDGGVRVKTRNVIKASELITCDPSSQTEPCGLTPCCTYGPWSTFSACSVGCGGGSQSRTRTVTKATPDTPCESSQDSQTCNTVQCCTYGDWSQWGECSAVCDGGIRKQTRILTKGSPDAVCTETTEKSEPCGTDPCCVYGEWSGWSSCSAVCGGGVITRTRSLTKKSATATCLPTSESQPCNSQNCCLFTEWSEWTKCSASCGGGVQKRSRSLLIVSSVVCPGVTEESQTCGTVACSVDCSVALSACDCLALKSSGCGWEAGSCKLGQATDCYECNQPGCSCGQVQTPCACAALSESGCGWSDFGVCKTGEFTTCDECPKKCGGCDCDVVTIVDASCSISADLWPRVSDWAQQIISATTGKGGVVVYTHKPWLTIPLTSDKASISKGLNNHPKCYFNADGSPNPCCGTNTDLALKAGADLLATSTSKCKTLVLITDGVSTFHDRTMAIAPTFKSLYPDWNIWAVAVGKRASYSELLAFVRNINDIAPFESSKIDYIAQCQAVGVGCAAAKTPCDCLALKSSGCGWSRQGICKAGAATDCYECSKDGCTCDAKTRCSCVALKELGCGWQSDPGFCGTGWGVTSSFGC